MKNHNQKQKRTQRREDAKATQRKSLRVLLRGSASLREKFFRLPLLLAICLVLTHAACKMDINQPVEAPKGSWDESLNTHPKGAAFQKLLDDYVKRGLPGVVMFVKSPQGTWNGAAGYAKIETKEPMTPTHLHPSGSVGKTYTAAAIMLLVEDGKIQLDGKINQYLPRRITDKIGNGNEATVRQLLNHTSGIKDFFDDFTFFVDAFNDFLRSLSPEKALEFIYGDAPYFPAGRGYTYSSTNYLLLALIMDHVLGENHANFISERIIRHLGLENTYYKNEPGYPTPPGLVNNYVNLWGNGQLQNYSDLQINASRFTVGHGGYIASSYDYALFLEALLKGELVSKASVNLMTDVASNPASGYGFGLGIYYSRYGKAIGHAGSAPGVQTMRYYYAERNTLLVLLTNGGDVEEVGEGQGKMSYLFGTLWGAAEDAMFE